MMAKRFQMPFAQWVNTNSAVQAGAKLEFFVSGTSTPLDTFTSETGLVANANPVVADGAGQFPAIFLQARDYKVTLKTSADVLLWTADPTIGGVEGTGQLLRRGYIDGFQLVNGPIDTLRDITFGAGEAQDSTNTSAINLASSLVKQIDAVWAAGTNLGGRASGVSLSIDTWYHCFVILNTATGAVDAGFDTSVSANNLLADATGFTKFRRVGSVITDGSSNIITFEQEGDWFQWRLMANDVSTSNPGTSDVTNAISTPLGVKVFAYVSADFTDITPLSNEETHMVVRDPDGTSAIASSTNFTNRTQGETSSPQAVNSTVVLSIRTDTSSQITYNIQRSDADISVRIKTLGWTDPRGRNG